MKASMRKLAAILPVVAAFAVVMPFVASDARGQQKAASTAKQLQGHWSLVAIANNRFVKHVAAARGLSEDAVIAQQAGGFGLPGLRRRTSHMQSLQVLGMPDQAGADVPPRLRPCRDRARFEPGWPRTARRARPGSRACRPPAAPARPRTGAGKTGALAMTHRARRPQSNRPLPQNAGQTQPSQHAMLQGWQLRTRLRQAFGVERRDDHASAVVGVAGEHHAPRIDSH